jgi:hypothetical protein
VAVTPFLIKHDAGNVVVTLPLNVMFEVKVLSALKVMLPVVLNPEVSAVVPSQPMLGMEGVTHVDWMVQVPTTSPPQPAAFEQAAPLLSESPPQPASENPKAIPIAQANALFMPRLMPRFGGPEEPSLGQSRLVGLSGRAGDPQVFREIERRAGTRPKTKKLD